METVKKITKTETRNFLKSKLRTSDAWAKRALTQIYKFQTDEEQHVGYTKEFNGVGFSGADSEILSSFAEFYKRRGFLSPKQLIILKKRIHKYWGQILKISNTEKMNLLIIAARG